MERGESTPWVAIHSPDAKKLRPRLREVNAKLKTLSEGDDEFENTVQERDGLWRESDRCRALEFKKISPSLEVFYKNRDVPYDRRLIIDSRGRLTAQGGIIQWGEDEETRARKLAEYQEEMAAFTEFLKQKFFAG